MSNDVAAIVERARLAAQQPAAGQPAGADRERLKHIAAEFESMLLVQVLKDMRRAGEAKRPPTARVRLRGAPVLQ